MLFQRCVKKTSIFNHFYIVFNSIPVCVGLGLGLYPMRQASDLGVKVPHSANCIAFSSIAVSSIGHLFGINISSIFALFELVLGRPFLVVIVCYML